MTGDELEAEDQDAILRMMEGLSQDRDIADSLARALRADVQRLTTEREARDAEVAALRDLLRETGAQLLASEQERATAERLSEIREAILTCYWFAVCAISAADKDDGHDEHEDCPGAVADASIQTARKMFSDFSAREKTITDQPVTGRTACPTCSGMGTVVEG